MRPDHEAAAWMASTDESQLMQGGLQPTAHANPSRNSFTCKLRGREPPQLLLAEAGGLEPRCQQGRRGLGCP